MKAHLRRRTHVQHDVNAIECNEKRCPGASIADWIQLAQSKKLPFLSISREFFFSIPKQMSLARAYMQ